MSGLKSVSKTILEETFKECYSELLRNPYAIDVKEHYAKIIHTYMTTAMRQLPQFLKPWFNDKGWKWNGALDEGRYYSAAEVEHVFSIISMLGHDMVTEFAQSLVFDDIDKSRNREKWNGYHKSVNENRQLKQQLQEKDAQLRQLAEGLVKYDKHFELTPSDLSDVVDVAIKILKEVE